MLCPKCGKENLPTSKFCQHCGTSLAPAPPPPMLCPKCGTKNLPTSKSCQQCGTPLSSALEIHQRKVKKFLRVTNIVIATIVIVGIPLYLFFGPPNLINRLGMERPVEQGISRDDAVTLATRRVQEEGVMSLSGRETVVKEEKEHWHISFPISALNVFGGEPHVIIDKASGAITEVYYTQ